MKFSLKALLVALLLVGAQAHATLPLGGSSLVGFFPAGHWVPAQQSMIDVFPQPDGTTAATAREHQAYCNAGDASTTPYDLAIGVSFGAYPYVFTLLQGPPGMSIEQTYYNTFQNVQYGRILWDPRNASCNWNGEVEVKVTDQQFNTTILSWGLWTVGQYSTSSFSAAYSVSGSTLTITGTCTGSLTPGTVVSDAAKFPAGTYVAFDLTGTGCAGTYALSAAPGGTPSGTITGAYEGGAVFISPTGSGTSCTYASPCSATQAFGPTFVSTSNPGAIVYAFGGTYSSTASTFVGGISGTTLTTSSGTPVIGENISGPGNTGVTEGTVITGGSGTSWTVSISQTVSSGTTFYGSNDLPAYTDTDTSGLLLGFELYATRKPNALIGVPGQSITLDATGGPTNGIVDYGVFIQTGIHADDWYMEGVTANAYNQNDVAKLVDVGSSRLTFDQVNWTNSGFGTGTSANMSMYYGNGVQTPRNFLFVTDGQESNRQSGAVGNNYAFAGIFSYNNSLFQRNYENSPSGHYDAVFYYKSDAVNNEMRENFANVADSFHAFDLGQAQWSGTSSNESSYNLGINIRQLQFNFAGSPYTWNNEWAFRNTIVAPTGQAGLKVGLPNTNLGGPWITGVTFTAGGSLPSGSVWYFGMTSTGVSGESEMISGSFGNASLGQGAGNSNVNTITMGSTGSATIAFDQEPTASTNNLYGGEAQPVSSGSCTGSTVTINTTNPHGLSTGAVVHLAGNAPGLYNGTPGITVTGASSFTYSTTATCAAMTTAGVYAPMQLLASSLSPSAGTVTYTGAAPTVTYPPTTPTALSSDRFYFYANAVSSTILTSPGPVGNAIVNGTGVLSNLIDAGTSTIICITVPSTGCPVGTQIGALNSSQSAVLGTVGYQIQ